MPTDLSPRTEAVIQQMLADGSFPDRPTLLDTAVGLLAAQREELRRLIQEGADSGTLSEEEVFAELTCLLDAAAPEAAGTR